MLSLSFALSEYPVPKGEFFFAHRTSGHSARDRFFAQVSGRFCVNGDQDGHPCGCVRPCTYDAPEYSVIS